MDKNVSSVNLDELKAAREALDKERGLETDPNMYNDYDPEKHKAEREQEKLDREFKSNMEDTDVDSSGDDTEIIIPKEEMLVSNDEEIILGQSENMVQDSSFGMSSAENIKVEETSNDDGELNLNIYDTFADFEVNSEVPNSVQDEEVEEKSYSLESNETNSNNEENSTIDSSNLDDFLKDLDAILSKDSSDDENISEDSNNIVFEDANEVLNTQTEAKEDNVLENEGDDENIISDHIEAEIDDEDIISDHTETEIGDENIINDNLDIYGDADNSKEEDNNQQLEPVVSADKFVETIDNDENKTIDSFENLNKDIFENSLEIKNYENLDETLKDERGSGESFNTEMLTDFSKLSTMTDEMEAEFNKKLEIENSSIEPAEAPEEVEEKLEEADDEFEETEEIKEKNIYKKIESFNFIDIMGLDEFKDADNFSYLLGKNEEGKLEFVHLKDTCGTVVFTRNEDAVFSGFSSILLSLLLKNTPQEMQFVVCDAMFDSDFDVFENSSYMYFNRVAKNNREIVDTLLELSKEMETRYSNLVYAGVKSISSYNLQAEERGTSKMPYIVVFINNYAKMTQFLDNEKINICLYNILKFGRIVGVYVILASAAEIERKEINFNLPTRIAYKTEDELDSVNAIGSEGAEKLVDDNDFLYSTVYDEKVKHLKVASLTKKEIELVIENLEN